MKWHCEFKGVQRSAEAADRGHAEVAAAAAAAAAVVTLTGSTRPGGESDLGRLRHACSTFLHISGHFASTGV